MIDFLARIIIVVRARCVGSVESYRFALADARKTTAKAVWQFSYAQMKENIKLERHLKDILLRNSVYDATKAEIIESLSQTEALLAQMPEEFARLIAHLHGLSDQAQREDDMFDIERRYFTKKFLQLASKIQEAQKIYHAFVPE